MDRNRAALIIFIRNPVPGKGKTRLAAKAGKEEAHAIYLNLLSETRKLTGAYSGPKYLYYSDFIDYGDAWGDAEYRKRVQGAGDLGEKMASAFREVLNDHPAAMIIGSDCPAIRPEDLEDADHKLAESDLVIGPSEDGGYYLLGMKRFYPPLFSGVPWSSSQTCAKTLEKAGQLNLHIAQLRQLYDIDTFEDWNRWQSE